jgi:hypothetical protein
MRYWAGVVTAEQFMAERLYARDSVAVEPATNDASTATDAPVAGDLVALIAASEPPVLFGLGQVTGRSDRGRTVVAYRHRVMDDGPPVQSEVPVGMSPLPPAEYDRLSRSLTRAEDARAGRSEWFVSVALPIEAATRAEAVREFWTYVEKLGPRELPAYVWPRGDELAMQAFVLGAVANLDPEEEAP